MKAKGSPKTTLKRTLTVILAAAAIVSAGNYADTPLTTATVQAATKKPPAVKNLRATKTTKKAITVKWTKVKNAVRYNVQVWKGSRCLKNKKTKTSTLRVAGLSAGATYTVKVTNFVKVNRQQVASAVATLKVKTKAAAASAPQEPSAPDVPQKPDTELPPVISVIPDTDTPQGIPEPEEPQEITTPYGTFWWDGTYADADYGIRCPDGTGTIYVQTIYMGGYPMTIPNRDMASEDFKQKKAAYENWRDTFLSTQVTDGMTDIEKCNRAGYYIDQRLDYDLAGISDCRGNAYECFARGKAACMESAMILGDFLAHMGIECQYRTLPQINHGNLWAMLDGQAYIVDGTVSDGTYGPRQPVLEPTALPKHRVYSNDTEAETCTVELMDGTEQTFLWEEAFPFGYTMRGDNRLNYSFTTQTQFVPDAPTEPGAPADPDDSQ